jgi:hypothetical protein
MSASRLRSMMANEEDKMAVRELMLRQTANRGVAEIIDYVAVLLEKITPAEIGDANQLMAAREALRIAREKLEDERLAGSAPAS